MLLFKPYHVYPIIEGIKTETRRFWAKPRAKTGSIHQCKLRMFTDAGDFFAKVEIKDIYVQIFDEMTEEAARAEGGYTLKEYAHLWKIINKTPLNPLEEVYVVEMCCIENNTPAEDLAKYACMYREHLKAIQGVA